MSQGLVTYHISGRVRPCIDREFVVSAVAFSFLKFMEIISRCFMALDYLV